MQASFRIDSAQLGGLIGLLRAQGYRVIGPTVRDAAIVLDEIAGFEDLPVGWTDAPEAGSYRLVRRDDAAVFGHVVGPHSARRYLQAPRRRLWRARREDGRVELVPEAEASPRYAFLGLRSCDLRAIEVQDRVLRDGAFPDEHYAQLRADALVISVQCAEARATCFCASMGSGPRAEAGFDLALTELMDGGRHDFLVEVGTTRGAELAAALAAVPAEPHDLAAAMAASARAAAQNGRRLDETGITTLLQAQPEHPRWDEVATRCLGCANCTLVCPTCFCTSVEDASTLDGAEAERWQRWDSCFNVEYSHLHGGSVRRSVRARYRQWLTHKLAHWYDQFGESGCVGCGRCIVWCPVGIDITEEVAAIRASGATTESQPMAAPGTPDAADASGANP